MKTLCAVLILLVYGKALGKAEAVQETAEVNNRSIFIITLDGFRWQELFSGADEALLQAAGSPAEAGKFYHHDLEKRRQLLMPFMWQVVAREGQVLGNRRLGNKVNVSNPYALSYAGYNELFTGTHDLRIWSNEAKVNANTTVLEKLNGISALKGKIASIGSWGMFPYIFNKKRSRLFVNAGKEASSSGVRSDQATFQVAKDYILKHRPRILHLGLGGTDEAGHNRQYQQYLEQAHLADGIIARLWNLVQSLSFYRDKTTFIITTDHGRGEGRNNWHKHGFFVRGSSQSWMALLGSGVLPLGEHQQQGQAYSRQVAGTIRYLLQATPLGLRSLPLSFFSGQDLAGEPVPSPKN